MRKLLKTVGLALLVYTLAGTMVMITLIPVADLFSVRISELFPNVTPLQLRSIIAAFIIAAGAIVYHLCVWGFDTIENISERRNDEYRRQQDLQAP